jgi:hypothetical protein
METPEEGQTARGAIPWSAQNAVAIMAAILAAGRLDNQTEYGSQMSQAVTDACLLYCLVELEMERDHLPSDAARRQFDAESAPQVGQEKLEPSEKIQ